ncbi:MAG: hypothetical protein B7Z51_02805 [Methyloversatilis sp. 12-65-5]|nr:MAG: hypothetical protein B7Z51_02805 [Methyloversatilis sp. 12-65-5]
MENPRAQREVETRLRDALHHDRARVQMGKISRFGLLELSRQRLRPALAETSYIPCPRCSGTGHIRSTESAALHILRILEEEAMKENTGAVHTQVPVDVATFLLNEKRADINAIELRHKVNIVLIPNKHLETPAHEIIRLRHDQLNLEGVVAPSYQMAVNPLAESYQPPSTIPADERPKRMEAAIKHLTPDQPAPMVADPVPTAPVAAAPVAVPAATPRGLFGLIASWFRGSDPVPAPVAAPVAEPKPAGNRERAPRSGDSGGRSRGRREGREGREVREPREGREQTNRADGRSEGRNEGRTESRNEGRPEGGRGEGQRKPREPRTQDPDSNVAQAERAPREPKPPREPREPRAPRERAANDAREQQQVDLPLGADSTQPENGVPTEGTDGAAPRSRRRRGGRRERGERRPEGAEAGAIGDVAAVEGDIEGVAAAANEAPVDLTDAQAPLALAATEPVVEASVFVPAVEKDALADVVVNVEPVEAVIEEAPMQTEVAAPAVMTVAEADAVEQISPEPVQAAPVIDTPIVADVPVVRPAPPVTDSAESTLVRAMESMGSSPIEVAPAPVAAPVDLQSSLDASGLVMVETQPGNSAGQAPIEPEPVLLGRRRRQATVIASEPMQQVETRGE